MRSSQSSHSLSPPAPTASCTGPGVPSKPFGLGPSGVGRANLDGTGVDQSFITFDGNPSAVAVDGAHVYWLNHSVTRGSSIGRAKLDGTGVEPSFIAGLDLPNDLAVDDAHIYWADRGGIGRANLDGTGADLFIEPPRGVGFVEDFVGVAVSGASIYWAFQESAPVSGFPGVPQIRSIGCANIDGTGANYELITADARNVALDAAHVYWTTSIGIGRANLDGTAAQEGFIPATLAIGVAANAANIYWTNFDGVDGHIGRANLDGSNVNQTFINPPSTARDVAVDGPPPGSPGTSSCPPPPPPPPNDFSFGKLKRNLKKGTAKLTVKVPGGGELELAKTKKVKADDEPAEAGGKEKLLVKPRGKAKNKLNQTGKAKVKAKVTYTPTGGEPNTESKQVKLKLRRR